MWKTSIRSGIPLLAAAAFGFGTATTMILQPEERLSAAPKPPAVSSFKGDFVAGLGELQPAGELVELGAEIAGIISRVDAVAGKHVQQGDILVEFESDLIESRLLRAEAELALQQAKYDRLRAGTRPQDFPIIEADRESALVSVLHRRREYGRTEALKAKQTITASDFDKAHADLKDAEARLARIDAELAKMKAGTWDKDLLIAEREVRVAAAELELAKAERKRYRIQAPCEAVVVKVDVRRGEHFDVANHEHPLVTLAPIGRMQVRVQVDEEDAGRVALSSQAEGFLRGPVRERLELRSLRLEPRVVPKSSTVGSSTERIDTRVMFLIYEVVSAPPRIYPGQRIDVFIQAAGPEHD